LFFNLRRLSAKLTREPRLPAADVFDAIATVTGVNRSDVELMSSRLSGFDLSLNAPIIDDNGASLERIDFLVDEGPLPDDIVEETIDTDRRSLWLRDALAILDERESRIVRERRLNENVVTLETMGRRLGISKERVRQIEARALGKMRRALSQIQDNGINAEP
jgi:RNA polymerase sigma-32 factor